MPACPACGAEHSSGKKFCQACGTALTAAPTPPAATVPAPNTVSCPACGQPAALGIKFCRSCGKALSAVSQAAATSAPAPRSPEPPQKPSPVASPQVVAPQALPDVARPTTVERLVSDAAQFETPPAIRKPTFDKTPIERQRKSEPAVPSNERQVEPGVARLESIPLHRPVSTAKPEKDLQQTDGESSSSTRFVIGSVAVALIIGVGVFFLVRHRQPAVAAAVVVIPPATPTAAEPAQTQPASSPVEPAQTPAVQGVPTQPVPAPSPAAAESLPVTPAAVPALAAPPQVRTAPPSTRPASSERVRESQPTRLATAPPPTASVPSQPAPADPVPAPQAPIQTAAPQPPPATVATPAPPASTTPRTEPPPQNSQVTPEPSPYRGPLNGTLTYSGPPVVENGEVVFRNLPPGRLALTYDQDVWDGRLSPGEANTQRLILRNKKPGTQKKCAVTWRVIQ